MSWLTSCISHTYAYGMKMTIKLTHVRMYNNIMHKSTPMTLENSEIKVAHFTTRHPISQNL